jgi:N-acetylmuramic acid 6-phosphate etherase
MPNTDLYNEISALRTEARNPSTECIDSMPARKILELMNAEDRKVAAAVSESIDDIEIAVIKIAEAFKTGGRLFYVGAGTSGRLGILDASECPPTFGVDEKMVQGIIAGGSEAVFRSMEGAEDSYEDGVAAVAAKNIKPPDIVCGITASGRTPYVAGALAEARKRGVFTILVSTAEKEKIVAKGIRADVLICPNVGPEVIAGSTRLKSGTAQKMVLNMLTTASMILLGKTLGNVMVDLQLKSGKLEERAKRVLIETTGCDYDEATKTLELAGGHVKTAIVMLLGNVDAKKARELLDNNNGYVRKAIISANE